TRMRDADAPACKQQSVFPSSQGQNWAGWRRKCVTPREANEWLLAGDFFGVQLLVAHRRCLGRDHSNKAVGLAASCEFLLTRCMCMYDGNKVDGVSSSSPSPSPSSSSSCSSPSRRYRVAVPIEQRYFPRS